MQKLNHKGTKYTEETGKGEQVGMNFCGSGSGRKGGFGDSSLSSELQEGQDGRCTRCGCDSVSHRWIADNGFGWEGGWGIFAWSCVNLFMRAYGWASNCSWRWRVGQGSWNNGLMVEVMALSYLAPTELETQVAITQSDRILINA